MNKYRILRVALMGGALLISSSAQAANIRFNSGVIVGSNSYGFDSNGDAISDVIFSTVDPSGFSNENPYLNNPEFNADFITGAVLGIPTNNSLRVDFVNGVNGGFAFSYIFSSSTGGQVGVSVFDSNNNLLVASSNPAFSTNINDNTLPNANFSAFFNGTASYALINASARFGIDEFRGTFSPNDLAEFNTPSAVPLPATIWLFAPVLLGLAGIRRRPKK